MLTAKRIVSLVWKVTFKSERTAWTADRTVGGQDKGHVGPDDLVAVNFERRVMPFRCCTKTERCRTQVLYELKTKAADMVCQAGMYAQ